MNLKFRMVRAENAYQAREDLELLKKVLSRNGISLIRQQGFGGEDIYTFNGSPEQIAKKMSRGAGAKSKTKHVEIETIVQMEKECRRKPKERKAALQKIGIGERRYEQIKKAICAVYGSLEEAVQQGYRWFVVPKPEEIKQFQSRKKREQEEAALDELKLDVFTKL